MSSLSRTAGVLLASVAAVSAHGMVQGIVAGGKYYQGWDYSSPWIQPEPVLISWPDTEVRNGGFVGPQNYTTPDIICHIGATNSLTHAPVVAGDTVTLEWTPWPDGHHGPVLDYLAKCDGPCEKVDKTSLSWFKIDHKGLITANPEPQSGQEPGFWAADELIANNNSWTVTIPPTLAPGNYVLRHEIIALHSANNLNGAQNYPFCFSLEVTSGGTEEPEGIPATDFYKPTDKGISTNIYWGLSTYDIPGPTVWSGGVPAITTGGGSFSAYAPTGSQPYVSTYATSTPVAGSSSAASSPQQQSTSGAPTAAPTTFATSYKPTTSAASSEAGATQTSESNAPPTYTTPAPASSSEASSYCEVQWATSYVYDL